VKKIICLTFLIVAILGQIAYAYSVNIVNVDKKQSMECIANELIGEGYSIVSTNDYSITAQKEITNFWGRVLYGSRFNSSPVLRISLNFAQIDNNVRLNGDAWIVTNPNSAFEQSQPYTNQDFPQTIDRFKRDVESKYSSIKNVPIKQQEESPVTVSGITISGKMQSNGNMLVSDVDTTCNAYISGVRKGDIIIKINEYQVKYMDIIQFKIFMENHKGKKITLTLDSFELSKVLPIEFEAQ
jgi:hypothetical protein